MEITWENSLYYNFYGYPVLPASFFIKKSCGTPEFHWDSNMDSHLVKVILGFKPAKGSEMKSQDSSNKFSYILYYYIMNTFQDITIYIIYIKS